MRHAMRSCISLGLIITSSFVGLPAALAQQTEVLQDTEFDPASWEVATLAGPFASDVLASPMQSLADGNPGAFRLMSHTVLNKSPGEFAFGWVWHRWTDHVVSLTTLEVTGVRYSADHRRINSGDDMGTTAYAAIFQNDDVYLAGIGTVLATSWSPFSTAQLEADDFSLLKADGSGLDTEQHPDFSRGAAELTFGYGFSNTPTNASFAISHGIDNWTIEITTDAGCGPADISGDGFLNATDINLFVTAFLANDPPADLNGDGNYNATDINLFVQEFLAGCD